MATSSAVGGTAPDEGGEAGGVGGIAYDGSGRPLRAMSIASSIIDCEVNTTQDADMMAGVGNVVFRHSLLHGYTYLAKHPPPSNLKQDAGKPAMKRRISADEPPSSLASEDPDEAPMFTPFNVSSASVAAGSSSVSSDDPPHPPTSPSKKNADAPDGMAKSPKWTNAQNSVLLTLIDSHDQTSTSGKTTLLGADSKFEYAPYLSTLFHSEEYCQSQLRKVPFINTRSGTKGMVDYVWLRSEWYLAGNFCASKQQLLNHVNQQQQNASDSAVSGGDKNKTSASTPAPSPYRNLHQKPHVHLYLVTCDTVDQYRTKVKPALMMFDKVCSGGSGGTGDHPMSPTSSAANTPTNSTHGTDPKVLLTPAPRKEPYLIIYVPKGQKPSLVGSVFGGHRHHHGSSTHSSGMGASGAGGAGVLPDCATTKEREVYKRLCADFSSPKVCMLSALPHFVTAHLAATATATSITTPPPGRGRKGASGVAAGGGGSGGCVNLSNTIGAAAPLNSLGGGATGSAVSSSASGSSSTLDIFSQEWSALLEKLGHLLAICFSERNKSYLAELKRLEQLKLYDSMRYKWTDTEYWLVKESMALGYQQFRLYKEALLSYEELSAWIPSKSGSLERCLLISVPGDEEEGVYSSHPQNKKDGEVSCPSSPTKVPAELQEELESLEKSTSDVLELEREAMTARLAAASDPETEAEKRRQLFQKAQDLLWQYSNAGESAGFRRVLTSSGVIATTTSENVATPVDALLALAGSPAQAAFAILESVSALQLHQYTYLRILHILVLLHRPVDILARSCDFVVQLYKLRCLASSQVQAASSSSSVPPTKEVKQKEAEIWALSTVWDIKCACETYYSFAGGNPPPPGGAPSSGLVSRGTPFVEQEREASRHLSQLLEFARLRLVKLGDLELAPVTIAASQMQTEEGKETDNVELPSAADYNPIRRAASNRAAQTLKEWIPWPELANKNKQKRRASTQSQRSLGTTPKEFHMSDLGTAVSSVSGGASTAFLTSVNMTNSEAFEDKYLELSDAIVALFDYAGRRRFASRLLGDQAEIYMDRGEYGYAAGLLEEIVDTVAKDGWHGLLFYRLFRLACCQRAMLDAPNYLQTLVKSFHPRFSPVAPKNVAELFQLELEALVQDEAIQPNIKGDGAYNHGMCPFLEMEMTIETSGLLGRKSHPLGYLRKKVIRHMCPAGEVIDVKLTIHCHVPREITVDSLRLFLMRADDFEHVYRTTGVLADGESFRVLDHDGTNKSGGDDKGMSVTLQPGKNVLNYRWIPMTVGQYVISSLDVHWGHAHFLHDCVSLRKAIQGIDVLPSDPTQKVVLNPLFLIPGETQEIRLAFSSNQDQIVEGAVELTCSDGLKVLPPGTPAPDSTEDQKDDEAWSDRCVAEIEGGGVNKTQYIKAWVKSDPIIDGDAAAQTLHARVRTNYHHALYEEVVKGDEPEAPPMSATLDASVTTLGRPALTVNTADAYDLAEGMVLVSVSLLCNTPVPFFIKKWETTFPPPLEMLEDGDANDVLVDHPVAEGQEIFFAFTCKKMDHFEPEAAALLAEDTRPTLVVILRDDQGKTFRQVLSLDLDTFYKQIKQELTFSGQNTAFAELVGSSDEGLVGSPVQFTYTVDVGSLNVTLKRKASNKLGASSSSDSAEKEGEVKRVDSQDEQEEAITSPLLYSVVCDHRSWIIAGKVGGIVPKNEDGKFSLDFVGIPTQSGVQKQFPKMKLHYAASPDGSPAPTLTVNCRVPESFVSLSFKNHVALAAPASIDATSN
jgi:hypothetical protein